MEYHQECGQDKENLIEEESVVGRKKTKPNAYPMILARVFVQ
jgi:hypothetical protein